MRNGLRGRNRRAIELYQYTKQSIAVKPEMFDKRHGLMSKGQSLAFRALIEPPHEFSGSGTDVSIGCSMTRGLVCPVPFS